MFELLLAIVEKLILLDICWCCVFDGGKLQAAFWVGLTVQTFLLFDVDGFKSAVCLFSFILDDVSVTAVVTVVDDEDEDEDDDEDADDDDDVADCAIIDEEKSQTFYTIQSLNSS